MSEKSKRSKLVDKLVAKAYRDQFVASHVSNGVAFQLKAMRAVRHWSQKELGERLPGKKMVQAGIARLENSNYGRYNLETLKRIASAFDVALIVRFVPFSQLVDWTVRFSSEDLTPVEFKRDFGLGDEYSSPDSTSAAPLLIESTDPAWPLGPPEQDSVEIPPVHVISGPILHEGLHSNA